MQTRFAQTCIFLYASINKINQELLKLVQMHFAQYILLIAFYKEKEFDSYGNTIFKTSEGDV
ncbi:hypothetical protein KTC96_19715 [Clostridium estertheticum]|uniref:hypothetical protein n=1 Tax=Clostridium estertheticum TaxID=238834 RepID=UPI001C7CA6CD|nr:hypothetical protein [Clostridium estertheticum]MBX4261765.1 hypothetical protein [Clostridium estertheticum]WLC70097.1 hypothetical protein KTC96_19715 [Clostridium estertheticum]